MSRARNLANLGNKSTIIGINTTNRVGIGSTIPDTKLDVDGVVTATSFSGSGSGLTGLANTAFINATQLNVIGVTTVGSAVTINSTGIDAVSGVITASSFVGNVTGTAGGLTGSPSINVTNITASGTLTYEDVTNVDSIGIVTARSGIEFGAAGVGGTITAVGNAEFAGIATIGGDVSIADKIIHTGDTNTALRFPTADTITAETAGSEVIRITSDGDIGIDQSTPRSRLDVFESTTGDQTAIRVGNTNTPSSANDKRIEFVDGTGTTEGTNKFTYGYIQGLRAGGANSGDLIFGTKRSNGAAPVEAMRIDDSGNLGIGTDIPATSLHVYKVGATVALIESIGANDSRVRIKAPSDRISYLEFADDDADAGEIRYDHSSNYMGFHVNNNVERLRITSTGNVEVVGLTSTASLTVGPGLIQEEFDSYASALTGTYNHDVVDHGMILYAYSNASASFVLNLRGDGSTTLNSLMNIGQSSVFTAYTGSNNTSYYMTDFQIDGASQTEEWNGAAAPTAATGSGYDVYTFNILKTADATFKVFATFSNFN